MPGPSETRIMTHVHAQLQLRWPTAKINRCNVGSGVLESKGRRGRWTQYGTPGQADLEGCFPVVIGHGFAPIGVWISIEVKDDDGRQSPAQRDYARGVVEAGGCYMLVRSADEAVRMVAEYIESVRLCVVSWANS